MNITLRFLLALTVLGIVSCEEKTDPRADFFGTWEIHQVIINDIDQTLSACEQEETLTFEEYNLCKHYDACTDTEINDSWSYTNDIINISSLLPLSYEVENVSSTNLNLVTYDFDSIGAVRVSQYKYVKVSE